MWISSFPFSFLGFNEGMTRSGLALVLLLPLLQEEDPVAALKALAADRPEEARAILARGLERDVAAAWEALSIGKIDEVERRLMRAALLSRSYSDEHARRVAAVVLSLRQEARAEGASLARGVAEELKAGRADAARARMAEAYKSPLLGSAYRADLDRIAAWIKSPPAAAVVDAELAKWKTARPAVARPECAACTSTGEGDCPSCLNGMVARPCKTCAGKGQAACVLCNGAGKLPHGGYVGKLRIVLERDVTVKVVLENGKTANMRIHAQTLIWKMAACSGGGCQVDSLSTAKDPRVPDRRDSSFVECRKLHEQLERFVFNGKAKIWQGDDPTKSKALTPEAARRALGEYAKCEGGFVPCPTCAGTTKSACGGCGGRGTRPGPCSDCGGTETRLCETCRLCGDASWVAAKLPAGSVPDVALVLGLHARELQSWQKGLADYKGQREQIRQKLAELSKLIDPKARVGPDYVNVACAKCQGKGGACADCWGTGRREYAEGSAEYEPYRAVERLQTQLAQVSALMAAFAPPPLRLGSGGTPPPPAPTPIPGLPPPSSTPPPGTDPPSSGIGGTLASLPADLKEKVEKADAAHEEGKKHLEKAKASMDKPDVWAEESKKSLEKFREAQTLYATVQETLDARGIDVPKELIERFRTNMQALVMARKSAP